MSMMPPRHSNSTERPILVLGAGGMLGTAIGDHFPNVVPIPKSALDITDERAVSRTLELYRPRVVINAAAYTSVDGAESNLQLARQTNSIALRPLAASSANVGAHLIHFSTDQVFDGSADRPWTEDMAPRPLNNYAATKLEGETPVLESGNTVLRVQWLYGEKKNRFVGPLSQREFNAFSDQVGAPTWTRDIAKVVKDVIEGNIRGLFHFSYDDYASWADVYEFAKTILGTETIINRIDTASAGLPARRPLNVRLSNQKLKNTLKVDTLGSWKAALQTFLEAHRGSH